MRLQDCRMADLQEGTTRLQDSCLPPAFLPSCHSAILPVRVALFSLALFVACPARAQQTSPADAAQPTEHRATDTLKFLAGGALGLAAHESGHLAFDVAFDARPYFNRVEFGGIPFFAISHADVSPRREFAIASAGFWVQEATNEWILTRHPTLRRDHAPLTKGVLAFNILASVAYAAAALAKAGPFERDTRGMAATVDVDERAIALIVLAPAVVDGYRYFRPGARWATWTSRIAKAGSVVLIVKGRS